MVIKFEGPGCTALWNCTGQYYLIYKDGKFVKRVFRFRDVKPYL